MMLLLCCLCFVLEIRAEEAVETVYRLKSRSVCLDAGGQPPYEHGKWSHGHKRIASDHSINPDYKKYIRFNKFNATLCIENLKKKHIGLYKFSFEKNFTNIYKNYKLVVEDAVPVPALGITVGQVNASTALCTFFVNCSISSDWLGTECDQDGCQTPHKSFTNLNITISNGNRTVTCTGNNHVSSQEASQHIEELCFASGHQEPPASEYLIYVKISVAILLSVITFIFIFFVASKIISTRRKNQPQVIQSQPLEQPSRISTSSAPGEASYENVDPANTTGNWAHNEESEKADTVYCELDPIPASASPQPGDNEETEGRGCEDIHTVYSVIKKSNV